MGGQGDERPAVARPDAANIEACAERPVTAARHFQKGSGISRARHEPRCPQLGPSFDQPAASLQNRLMLRSKDGRVECKIIGQPKRRSRLIIKGSRKADRVIAPGVREQSTISVEDRVTGRRDLRILDEEPPFLMHGAARNRGFEEGPDKRRREEPKCRLRYCRPHRIGSSRAARRPGARPAPTG